MPTCMAWEGHDDFKFWFRKGRLCSFCSEKGGRMGFPAEALTFCTSQTPCRYETPEAEEGERTIWVTGYLTI